MTFANMVYVHDLVCGKTGIVTLASFSLVHTAIIFYHISICYILKFLLFHRSTFRY